MSKAPRETVRCAHARSPRELEQHTDGALSVVQRDDRDHRGDAVTDPHPRVGAQRSHRGIGAFGQRRHRAVHVIVHRHRRDPADGAPITNSAWKNS
jgi:hypothetical protein